MINQQSEQVVAIVRDAGQAVMKFFRASFTVRDKSPDNPVTEADIASDTLLKRRLGELLPEAGWLSEETADNPARLEKKWLWVVDPIDGTKEFVMGIPEFSISVALVEDGLPVLGIVFNPVTDELFVAEKGQGMWCNGAKVGVSGRDQLQGALIDASRSEIKRGEFDPFKEAGRVTHHREHRLQISAGSVRAGRWNLEPWPQT
jgi:myo-inositol-1(or 4)-monophosphatase